MADKNSIGKSARYIESIVQNLTQGHCANFKLFNNSEHSSKTEEAKFLSTRRYHYSHFSLILVIRLKAELSHIFPFPPFAISSVAARFWHVN